ncbi:glycoside hydrolase family 71/99-like protein [Phycisphaerales bacterium AB-hyl4]|uniref:Glycoside hydrolase family 71/99-like protein n=1 Tax=Natronomicrosphaera hydrolytica TaxID=3242702 RepID=A0ABV4U3K5_9BACT
MSLITRREFHHRVSAAAMTLLAAGGVVGSRVGGDAMAMATTSASPAGARVDPKGLHGKVMCGYQGWFRSPGDGSGLGWQHYVKGDRFEPGHCTIDFWPDLSEFDDDEKFATPFRHADGSTAYAFSSQHPKTVDRHFRWMKDYGIDGVFVQRFVVEVARPGEEGIARRDSNDVVLQHCRASANRHGRAYAVMYDLSGMGAGEMERVKADWRHLVDDLGFLRRDDDRQYLHHDDRPVVAVWGVGFGDRRRYSVAECDELIEFFKNDPQYGGVTLMLGVPTGWREQERDASSDRALPAVLAKADIISPWTVGRFRNPSDVAEHAELFWQPDLNYCQGRGQTYLPVVFPGFSWVNLKGLSSDQQIPRLGGQFLWSQYAALREMGAPMVYQAMFDEIDEGTQIFKVTNDPPVGESVFRTYKGLPSDHYLWLVGQATRMIRGEAEHRATMPLRVGSEAIQRELMG